MCMEAMGSREWRTVDDAVIVFVLGESASVVVKEGVRGFAIKAGRFFLLLWRSWLGQFFFIHKGNGGFVGVLFFFFFFFESVGLDERVWSWMGGKP